MKTRLLATLALGLLSLHIPVQAQSALPNELRDRLSTQMPIVDGTLPGEFSHKLLGFSARSRMRPDGLRMTGDPQARAMQSPLLEGGFNPNVLRSKSGPLGRALSPPSQFSVIDTAIVRSTVDTTRYVYAFDAKARMTSGVGQKLKGGLWVDTVRSTIVYDANGNTVALAEGWMDDHWVYSRRTTSTHDTKGNVLSFLDEFWSNGQWVVLVRNSYTYNANGNLLTDEGEYGSNGQGAYSHRYTYTYDPNGNLLSTLMQTLSNGQWGNDLRNTYTWTTNRNMLTVLDEKWSTGQWVNNSRDTYTYDPNGNQISAVYEYAANGQLMNSERLTYTYDAGNKALSKLTETWMYGLTWTSGQWVNDLRDTYAYDGQENLTSVWFYLWLDSSWTSRDRTSYGPVTRDSAGNSYNLANGFGFSFIRKLTVTGVASPGVSVPATYSLSQNYPNPFNPTTTIRYSLPSRSHVTLTVFNTLGQQVAGLANGEIDAGNHEVQFNASNMASGVYFYRLQAGGYVETKKLVLTR